MRTVFFIFLVSFLLIGCSKHADVKPIPDKPAEGGQTGNTPVEPPVDTVKKLTRDDSLHMVAFIIYPQYVKTSVTGKTLTLLFDENVNLFLTAEAYQKTSAVHLKEDFKSTSLGAFDFTTINQDGQTTYNSIDDNLNNVKLKTISDTLIDRVNVVKVNVHRPVTFSKVYNSNQLAVSQQNLLLGKANELLTFSSYVYYNQKNYPVTSAVAYLQYVK